MTSLSRDLWSQPEASSLCLFTLLLFLFCFWSAVCWRNAQLSSHLYHMHDVLFLFSNSVACLNCCESLSLCVWMFCFESTISNAYMQAGRQADTHTRHVVIVDSFIHFYWTDQVSHCPSSLGCCSRLNVIYIDTSSIDGGANNYYGSQINSRNLLINKLQTDMYRRCFDLAYYDRVRMRARVCELRWFIKWAKHSFVCSVWFCSVFISLVRESMRYFVHFVG